MQHAVERLNLAIIRVDVVNRVQFQTKNQLTSFATLSFVWGQEFLLLDSSQT